MDFSCLLRDRDIIERTQRRQFESLLDGMDEKDPIVMLATAKGIHKAKIIDTRRGSA